MCKKVKENFYLIDSKVQQLRRLVNYLNVSTYDSSSYFSSGCCFYSDNDFQLQRSPQNSGSVNSEILLIQTGDYGPC